MTQTPDSDTEIDIAGQTLRLRRLAQMAEALGSASSLSAAIRAEQEINKLHGLVVGGAEDLRFRAIEDLDDVEIDALIASAER